MRGMIARRAAEAQLVGNHPYGYTGFDVDLTRLAHTDGKTPNVIAVKVQNQLPSSRRYSGSGIYRNVHLVITDPVHVARHGIFVTTPDLEHTITPGFADLHVRTSVVNDAGEQAAIGSLRRGLVADGDTVLLDVGTTTAAIARALVARTDLREVTVVTSGLRVALELERAWPRLFGLVTGGTLRPLQHSLVNPLGTVVLERLKRDDRRHRLQRRRRARRGDEHQPARGRDQARDPARRPPADRGGRRLQARRGRGGEGLRRRRGEHGHHRSPCRSDDCRRAVRRRL
jgi:hypothetical protein